MSIPRRRRVRAIARAISPVVACAFAASAAAIPAFPGAEGAGANSLGGRGGEVFHVTSLGDTNSGTYSTNGFKGGTLRYCLQHNSAQPRTIVFDVGGTIPMSANLDIKRSRVTLAGQTAPGPGITLRNYTFQITSSNSATTSDVVVRYLRSRKGNVSTAEDAMGVLGSGTTRDIMIDHVSASWGQDENLSLTNNSTNVTVQYSIMSEGLNAENHGYGSLLRPRVNAQFTMHHNLWSSNLSRNPRVGTYDDMTLDLDLRNNVMYNWADRASYAGGSSEPELEHANVNFIGNYLVAGPSTPLGSKSNTAFTKDKNIDLKAYQLDNRIDGDHDLLQDGVDTGWAMWAVVAGSSGSFTQMRSPFPLAAPATDSPETAYEKVLASAGAFPWNRDAVDVRVTGQVKSRTGAVINAPDPTEWNNIVSQAEVVRPANWDTDFDGMPNAWESARGFNPSVADNNDLGPNQYTNLENYLHELTIIANWAVDADASWNGVPNWFGSVPGEMGATANFGPVITAPRTVSLASPMTVGQLNFDSAHAYTIAGASALTLDVISGTAAVGVVSGSHLVSAPVVALDDTVVNVGPANASLALSGGVNATEKTITKSGDGVLRIGQLRAGGLSVGGGVVRLDSSTAAPHVIGALAIAGTPSAPTAALDLTDDTLVIDYDGASPVALASALLASGYAGGSWTGNGISSSMAAGAAGMAVGLAEAGAVGIDDIAGEPIDDTSLVLSYTRYGDTNLDHQVNLADFNVLAASFGISGKFWFEGDFNFDSIVNLADFNLLAANFGLAASSANGPTAQDWAALAAVVPEPGLGLGLLLAVPVMRRRR